jgi:hypothetical protein|tara:strand:- start:504 stop:695 length:192 start_codon:yes stop_codon:yes gene_type:complete
MPSYSSNKSVSFKNSIIIPKKNIYFFEIIPSIDFYDLPPISEIIWGKGFKSMIGVSWSDESNA